MPQNNYAARDVSLYGLRWIFSFLLLELLTHVFHYNAFAIRLEFLQLNDMVLSFDLSLLNCKLIIFVFPLTSGLWKLLSPVDIFIIGYGVR